MNKLSLIASALAVLGLTACEKGLVEDGIEGQTLNIALVEGTYSVYAVGGASTTDYVLLLSPDETTSLATDITFRLTADPDWDSVNGYTF